ncbi:MAG: hypothetical protein LBR75_06865, partial [Prevotellaceae bacterium]|nr:hypothetical protein [Prevotellaceae bacterium]
MLFLLAVLMLGCSSAFAQLNNIRYQSINPATGQPGSDALDITMISGIVLQPMWLATNSTLTSPVPVRAITTQEQLMAGDALVQNNRMAGDRGLPNERENTYLPTLAPPESVRGTNQIFTGVVYADVDEDNTTFQSSAAFLDFGAQQGCTTIEKAFLYWTTANGHNISYPTPYKSTYTASDGTEYPTNMNSFTGSGANIGRGSNGTTDKVKIMPPGATQYIEIEGERIAGGSGQNSTFVADISQHLAGLYGGLFWVADIASGLPSDGGEPFNVQTGWSLVVIYRPQNSPPRSILLVDGTASGNSNVTLTGLVSPATNNAISYLGYMGLDAEGFAAAIAGATNNGGTCANASAAAVMAGDVPIKVRANNGTEVRIAQFTDQPPLSIRNSTGSQICDADAGDGVFDGSASSTMSTYNKTTGLNGDPGIRLPDTRYTAGYDAHHVLLPAGAIPANATSATLTLPQDFTGSWGARMAYLAIETLTPNLKVYMDEEASSEPLLNGDIVTAPGGTLTYKLRVENIGTLASAAGVYFDNKLPIMADLQNVGTIQYFNAAGAPIAAPQAPVVTGEDTDNETIRFYIPALATGDGITATDWVTIHYTVDIKGLLDRPDIWQRGCNRFVENIGILYEASGQAIIGSVPDGETSIAGCNADGIPLITRVVSTQLDQAYEDTHIITLSESSDLVQRIQASADPVTGVTSININTELKAILKQQYATLNWDVTEVDNYYTINRDGFPVGATETFKIVEGEGRQEFTADATLPPNDCEETFRFIIDLIKIPNVTEDLDSPNGANAYTTCAGNADAVLNVKVSNGTPGYSITITNTVNGAEIFTGFSPAGQNDYTFVVQGVAAGIYDILVGDKNGNAPVKQVTVEEPDPIVPNIISICTTDAVGNKIIKLTGSAKWDTDGDGVGDGTDIVVNTLDWVWKQGTTVLPNPSANANIFDAVPGSGAYELVVCSGTCTNNPQNDPLKTVVITLPTVSVTAAPASLSLPENTALVSIAQNNPQATFTAKSELSGMDFTANYNYAWTPVPADGIPGTLDGKTTSVLKVDIVKDDNKTGLRMNGNIYTVKASEGANCVGLADGVLNVVDAPAVTLNSWTPSTCPDAIDATMEVTIKGGSALHEYDITIVNQVEEVYSAQYTADAPQIVNLTGLRGCIAEDPLTGECLQAAEYTWSVTDSSIPLTVSDDLVTITATPRPVTTLTVEDVCFGEELIATASGGYPNYEWTVGGMPNSETNANLVFDYMAAGLVQGATVDFGVVALSEDFCRSMPQTKTITLKTVPDPLLPQELITDQSPLVPVVPFTSCVKQEGQDWAKLVANPDAYELRWFDVEMGGIGVANPDLLNLGIPGEYSKWVSAVSAGCPSLRTEIKAIVYPNPVIVSIDKQNLKSIVITVAGGQEPYWYDYQGIRDRVTEDGVKAQFEIATPEPPALGQHKFLVIDDNLCQVEGNFLINKTLLQPMAYFSPNGDNAADDYWRIGNLEAYLDSHITIE